MDDASICSNFSTVVQSIILDVRFEPYSYIYTDKQF